MIKTKISIMILFVVQCENMKTVQKLPLIKKYIDFAPTTTEKYQVMNCDGKNDRRKD